MPKAPPSTKSSGKVTLSFGLINIPLTVWSGTVSNHGTERHEYIEVKTGTEKIKDTVLDSPTFGQEIERDVFEDHSVGRGLTDKTTGLLLEPEEKAKVVKKYETEYGPVYVEDSEIESLFTLEPNTLKIHEFQPLALFNTGRNYVPKSLLYIEPDKQGTGAKKAYIPAALKVFNTLLKAMRTEGAIAVGELTTRGVPKPCILTPDGALWLVWHTDALREQRDLPEIDLDPADVSMMGMLIQALTKTEPADLSDKRSELIQNFADEKAAAGDFSKGTDTYVAPAAAAPAFDMAAMLQASIDAAKQAS